MSPRQKYPEIKETKSSQTKASGDNGPEDCFSMGHFFLFTPGCF